MIKLVQRRMQKPDAHTHVHIHTHTPDSDPTAFIMCKVYTIHIYTQILYTYVHTYANIALYI